MVPVISSGDELPCSVGTVGWQVCFWSSAEQAHFISQEGNLNLSNDPACREALGQVSWVSKLAVTFPDKPFY